MEALNIKYDPAIAKPLRDAATRKTTFGLSSSDNNMNILNFNDLSIFLQTSEGEPSHVLPLQPAFLRNTPFAAFTPIQPSCNAPSIDSLGLILHPLDPRTNCILVSQIPSVQRAERTLLGNGLHVVVKLVYKRRAGGYVQLGDDVLADAVKSLHQSPERIAVRGDDHGLSRFEHGRDVRLEVRRDTLEGGLETLRPLVGEVESGVPFVKVGGEIRSKR